MTSTGYVEYNAHMANINALIKEKRERMGLTQEQLGLLVGKDRTTVNKYETGRTGLTLPVAKKLSTVLKIPVTEFLK